jgi:hypothetical protein
MKTRTLLFLMLIAILLSAGPIGLGIHVQGMDEQKTATHLTVINETGKATEISTDSFAKLRRKSLKVKDHSGTEVTFEGVALVDLVAQAGVALGKELKGPKLANCLLIEAADGYRVVLALPEIDPAMTDSVILLADCREGQALDAKHGPYELVVPQDKRQSRWVRQVVKISVVRVGDAPKQK